MGRAPIRDSKIPHGHMIDFRDTAWISFIAAVRNDELPGRAR
ncbi:DUF397 domain-containing protein [Streptomyces sp. NPDC097595]